MVTGLYVLEKEGCHKTRYHGDYHLGQVLRTGYDFIVLDFEGEPARTLAERRAKHCPLKDVAGLLRSFNYAAYAVLFEVWKERHSDEHEKAELESWALVWENLAHTAFLEGYFEATSRHTGPRFMPADTAAFQHVVEIFEVEKAFYELNYEFNNRPGWIPIPATGLMRILRDAKT
jgi:maltose alpha-D-glucosyltransferase/alpha-amylase